ncbi:cytochrome c oxidase assembly protein [Roseomonas sp. SSH11]|uniref:Cytochrome c oxidase assembly protein n=1 Tax=Pararoseomonas baculiformis TaxID=2820812 RepID=A0ABS4AEW2_9PROT|nr:cytochrome c oxidase assembly protein [Pararoseomonas baculiformis]MBP0445406.1 cytochrome c oxidase assembly protein [Pararoseomonas baculiformis]
MRALAAPALTALLLLPHAAWAHGGEQHEHGPGWTFDPWVLTPLLVSLALYLAGTARLWSRAGYGRGIRPWQLSTYLAGWLFMAGALLSPLHWFGERVFTLHMIEHEIVMAVAAPLLVLARPAGALAWALPARWRHALGRIGRTRPMRAAWLAVTAPVFATLAHGVAIWAWHIPVLFDAAVVVSLLHRLQHLSFILTALIFWWALLRRCSAGSAALHLFVTMMHTGVLGALMALAPRVLYTTQTAQAGLWGLTPLEDQQLAGLVMWIPAGTIYVAAALGFTASWISRAGRGGKVAHAP